MDKERFGEILRALGAHARDPEGTEPPAVEPAEAAFVARVIHNDMDECDEQRSAAAEAAGHTLACGRGCNACCANVIFVYDPEALAVAQWLTQPENRDALKAFVAVYPEWKNKVGARPQRVRALHAKGDHDGAQALFEDLAKLEIMCAFNGADGECIIHPVRPVVCRNTHALDTAEHCSAASEERPAAIAHEPTEQLVDQAAIILRTMQRAMRGEDRGAGALCDVVYALVSRAGLSPE